MKYQEMMDKIKVESYEDCIWYMGSGKCKLPGLRGEYTKCSCKSGDDMDEFCIWITKFLKSTPPDKDMPEDTNEDTNTEVEKQWDEYNELILDEESNQVLKIENPIMRSLSRLFKKL